LKSGVPVKLPSGRNIALCALIATAAGAAIAFGLRLSNGDPRLNAESRAAASEIDSRLASLGVSPPSAELVAQAAARTRHAIQNGDYGTAHQVVAKVLRDSHLQNWRFYPFSDFIGGVSDVNDPAFEGRLTEWVSQNANDPIPVLVRAQYYLDLGWFKRGRKFVKDTEPNHLDSFQTYMVKALADATRATDLDGDNPYAVYLKLCSLRGFGASAGFLQVFNDMVGKFPSYYPAYAIVLRTLEPKWGGSVPAMYAFVERHAGAASEHSPLKLLYLDLYQDLLDTAWVSCNDDWRDHDKLTQCTSAAVQRIITPDLERKVLAASQIFDHTDHYQFGLAVGDILQAMLDSPGADFYSGAVLQLVANSMHSDTALKKSGNAPNNYVVDELVSQSWYGKEFYDNALNKAKEALDDAKQSDFPDEMEKDVAIGQIYASMARAAEQLHQYADVILYEKAAITLGGPNDIEHYICHAYHHLGDDANAIRACTQAIADDPANLSARYWRGVIYYKAGRADEALGDLSAVADSENGFRGSAALTMSMIYFDRKDLQGALDVLNRYTYLYDPNTESKGTIAASYNNRCYAYMELGDLQKALNECTASLQYGSLPDAYRKQQELVKRLAGHESRL